MSTPPPAVSAVGLARRLGGAWALRGVDLELAAGRSLMLFGPNGAGKTTLIRVLATALAPSAGTLRIFGAAPIEARGRVAMLSHADHHYDDLTARENLELVASLGAWRATEGADGLLARVGLARRADDAVRGFSAGMRKRLAFARLLARRADLVLLDEPYAQLDPEGHLFVDGLLRELVAAGTSLIVSTHQVARVATLCHEAVRLGEGRVSWLGPANQAVPTAGD